MYVRIIFSIIISQGLSHLSPDRWTPSGNAWACPCARVPRTSTSGMRSPARRLLWGRGGEAMGKPGENHHFYREKQHFYRENHHFYGEKHHFYGENSRKSMEKHYYHWENYEENLWENEGLAFGFRGDMND